MTWRHITAMPRTLPRTMSPRHAWYSSAAEARPSRRAASGSGRPCRRMVQKSAPASRLTPTCCTATSSSSSSSNVSNATPTTQAGDMSHASLARGCLAPMACTTAESQQNDAVRGSSCRQNAPKCRVAVRRVAAWQSAAWQSAGGSRGSPPRAAAHLALEPRAPGAQSVQRGITVGDVLLPGAVLIGKLQRHAVHVVDAVLSVQVRVGSLGGELVHGTLDGLPHLRRRATARRATHGGGRRPPDARTCLATPARPHAPAPMPAP